MIDRQIFTIQTKPIKLSRSPITASGADFHNKSGKLHALASFSCTSKEIFIAWRQLPYCFLFIDGVESVTASPSVLLWINNKPKVEGWWCHRSTGESCRHSWAVSNHRAQPPVCWCLQLRVMTSLTCSDTLCTIPVSKTRKSCAWKLDNWMGILLTSESHRRRNSVLQSVWDQHEYSAQLHPWL